MNHLLFSVTRLRGRELKNRICVPPMVCFGWTDETGVVDDHHVAHYAALAVGGPALIIQEATCIHPDGRLAYSQLGVWDDSHIPGLRRIADAVHAHDVPILMQIHHAGIVACTDVHLCPSDYSFVRRGETVTGKEMTPAQIEEVREQFIEAAVRAEKAGYDGVELHGCHSYLLCQFHNRRVNRRWDSYGDDPLKLTLEILQGIRARTGKDFIVGIRLGGFEPSLSEAVTYAKRLDEAGIDFINVSYGFGAEQDPRKPEDYPHKDIIYAAQEIKAAVKTPVFAVNGIKTPGKAESVLETTGVDMVCIGRGFLVNYNWANDARDGVDPGKCIECPNCFWRNQRDTCPGHDLLEKSRK